MSVPNFIAIHPILVGIFHLKTPKCHQDEVHPLGTMFLQRFMATPIDVEIFQSVTRLLHCSNLYELLEQDGSFHQVFTEAQLGHHPVLDLIEATHKPLQVSRDDT